MTNSVNVNDPNQHKPSLPKNTANATNSENSIAEKRVKDVNPPLTAALHRQKRSVASAFAQSATAQSQMVEDAYQQDRITDFPGMGFETKLRLFYAQ